MFLRLCALHQKHGRTLHAVLVSRYGDFGQMFERMLRDVPDEHWEVFYPVDDHWPSAEQMASYQVLKDTLALLLLCSAL